MWVYLLTLATCAFLLYFYISHVSILIKIIHIKVLMFIYDGLIEDYPAYFIINYPFGLKWYKLIVMKSRVRMCSITSELDNGQIIDIKPIVKQYLGPYDNFCNNHNITPEILGFNNITFTDTNNIRYKYLKHDRIKF